MRRCLNLSWLSSYIVFVGACAASPVVDFPIEPAAVDPEPEPEDVGGTEADDEPDDDTEGETDDETDDKTSPDAASSTASATAPLASADAGSATGGDAGARADAGAVGRDAAAPRPSLLPTLPGGLDLGNLSPPRTRACMAAADCTVSCFPLGVVSCCRPDHVCGCSWAPGAYCL